MNFPSNNRGPNSPNPFTYSTQPISVADSSVDVRMNFIRKTYSLFLAGILCALLVGTLTLNSAPVFGAAISVLRSPILSLVLLFGLSMGAQAVSRIEGLNYAALFGFTGFIGFMFAPLLAMYELRQPGIVTQAALLTSITFGALTAYAFISKKDFSFLGGMLFVGIIALVLGGLANVFFFKSSGASYWMAWVTVLIFAGFVLFDTSRIIHRMTRRVIARRRWRCFSISSTCFWRFCASWAVTVAKAGTKTAKYVKKKATPTWASPFLFGYFYANSHHCWQLETQQNHRRNARIYRRFRASG